MSTTIKQPEKKPKEDIKDENALLLPSEASSLNKSHLALEIPKNDILERSNPSSANVESPTLLWIYMMLAGLISLLPMFMMLSEVHVFNKKFKKFNFDFFVLMPSYASIPYSLLGNRLLKGLSLTTKIEINLIGSSSFMALIYIFFFFVPFKDEYNSNDFFSLILF